MAKLQPTYGNFKVYGEVQGLTRNYAWNDDDTQSGLQKHKLRFDVKTREDNIVTVDLLGFKFDKVKIMPKDFENKERKDLPYSSDVYDKIPEDWQVVMGVTAGLEQGDDGKNILKEFTSYDAAKYIYDNLKDGDVVFISGNNNVNAYTNSRSGEEIINYNHDIQRIYKSNREFDPTADDFKEMSSFDQNIIIQAVDLDKKEKKAYVQAYVVYNRDGDFAPLTFWIDGAKRPSLVKNLNKLEFGTVMKVSGIIHSTVTYTEVESETDEWGDEPEGYQKRAIKNVEKSYEITKGYPETLEEGKYQPEDFVKTEDAPSDNENPFEKKEGSSNSEWGDAPNSNADPFDDSDPFGEEF